MLTAVEDGRNVCYVSKHDSAMPALPEVRAHNSIKASKTAHRPIINLGTRLIYSTSLFSNLNQTLELQNNHVIANLWWSVSLFFGFYGNEYKIHEFTPFKMTCLLFIGRLFLYTFLVIIIINTNTWSLLYMYFDWDWISRKCSIKFVSFWWM